MNRDWRPLTLITQLGVTMAVSIVGSLLLGLWIDGHFGAKPWATLVLALLGILGGSVAVYQMVADAINSAADQGHAESGESVEPIDERKENE